MAELADAHDSKSCSFGNVGSIPTFGTVGIITCPPAAAGEHRSPGMMHPLPGARPLQKVSRFVLEVPMRPYLIFLLLDLILLVAYPILYVIDRLRRFFQSYR